ncbi:MAG: ATP-dependent DNA helicase RecQ [Motiliproteus sp.]|jgi:ATP-dependent DNA helicase RecQ
MNDTQQILQQQFRLQQFRPGQEAVVAALLAGRSALAIFPTGGGKSLCYQLPALLLEGLTLVVSPLIALMKDQVDSLQRLGIAAERLDSSLGADQVRALYDRLQRGEVKLLYVSPERLKNERFVARLKRLRISMMAVDEAHCISEWGHNFRPDYLKLADLARALGVERVLALTATATPAVAADICRQFGIQPADHIQTSFARPNLSLSTTACSDAGRLPQLIERLQQLPENDSAIVYVTLQHTAEAVASALRQQGLDAAFYHAGMDDEKRYGVQDRFMAGRLRIVVATIAFGMGIDKSDIRAIFHYNLPKSIENYVQEIGRAGRDGQPSTCELLACGDDSRVLANFSFGDTPSAESLALLLDELLLDELLLDELLLDELASSAPVDQPDHASVALGTFDVSTYDLSSRFDIRPLVVSTLLTYLELEGVIAATGPFYSQYRLAFNEPAETLCARFDSPERQQFLRSVFAAGSKGRKWLTLDMMTIEATIGQPTSRIIKALDYLQQQGWIESSVSGLRQGYRRLRQPDREVLLASMLTLFETRERRDIERLEQMLSYVNHSECLGDYLLGYFGETSQQPCGNCSRCRQQPFQAVEPVMSVRLDDAQLALLAGVRAENHQPLRQPRQLSRFLCGLPSPATARSTLRQHRCFGAFSALPFLSVLAAVVEAKSGG